VKVEVEQAELSMLQPSITQVGMGNWNSRKCRIGERQCEGTTYSLNADEV